MTDETAIIAANAAFYAAFAAGDISEVSRLWADDDDISCIHPGWPAIVGREAVLGSWRDILQNPNRPQIACAEPHAIIDGNNARVLCNHFRRIDGAWRLVHHQSSPIAQMVTPANDDIPSRRIH
jgi:ketosteroid isomerase-like protein